MKKIIFVNNNMKVGGVQKSLYNLLWTIKDQYEITLLLFEKKGEYLAKIPQNIEILSCDSMFRYLGINQSECSTVREKMIRGILAVVCRIFGRSVVMKLILASQSELQDNYDCAISYLHNGSIRSFYGGVNEFVLNKIHAEKKIAFLHCDYQQCGANSEKNNRCYDAFDSIVACSVGCQEAFLEVMPQYKEKTVVIRNCHRYDEIRKLADTDTFHFEDRCLNILMVARLAHEKGIERAIEAIFVGRKNGFPVVLHLVGDGGMKEKLKKQAKDFGIEQWIKFYGEQANPYRFMKYADLLLVTSFHEAAPMVIDEALSLALPVFSVKTTSSEEMIIQRDGGWVCANSQEAINSGLIEILSNPDQLRIVKEKLKSGNMNNRSALTELNILLGE